MKRRAYHGDSRRSFDRMCRFLRLFEVRAGNLREAWRRHVTMAFFKENQGLSLFRAELIYDLIANLVRNLCLFSMLVICSSLLLRCVGKQHSVLGIRSTRLKVLGTSHVIISTEYLSIFFSYNDIASPLNSPKWALYAGSMILGQISWLDCFVFLVFLAPQLIIHVGFFPTLFCGLRALPFLRMFDTFSHLNDLMPRPRATTLFSRNTEADFFQF